MSVLPSLIPAHNRIYRVVPQLFPTPVLVLDRKGPSKKKKRKMNITQFVCGIFLFNARFMRNSDALALKLIAALVYLVVCRLPVLRLPPQRLIVRRMSILERAIVPRTSRSCHSTIFERGIAFNFDMVSGSTQDQGVLGSGCFLDGVAPDATVEERAFQVGGRNNIE